MSSDIKPDAALKDYWRDNDRFADLFNQVFFDGEESIDPVLLSENDTDESAVLMVKEQVTSISRQRDVIKQYKEGAEFVLIGLENQMNIHYAMPVRSLVYDALRYVKQCKELERQNRKDKILKGPDEFLSGITKNDRIKPVITLIIYYGEKEYDGPTSLSDMMDIPHKFQRFVNDQSIQLLQVRNAGKIGFRNQDNHDFFTMIEEFYHNNGKIDLTSFKQKYPDMEVYWETLAALGAATGIMELVEYAHYNKGGRLNMCIALENLKKEGKEEGIHEMVEILRELNIDDETILKKLQEKFQLSIEEASELL